MKQYRVRYLNEAKAALREATAYIVDNAGSGRARDWLRKMRKEIDKLERLPFAFPQAAIQDGRAIHARLMSPYRVYYTIDERRSTVYVIDVVHTSRETKLKKYRAK